MKKTPLQRYQRRLLGASALALGLLGLLCWKEAEIASARWVPDYEKEPLPLVERVSDLQQEELDLLFRQTGLTELGLLALEEAGRLAEIPYFQQCFFLDWVEVSQEESLTLQAPFSKLPVLCLQNTPISWEEMVLWEEGYRGAYLPMVPLEEGDILLTPNSRSFGWRQGHAALVIGEEQTLESFVMGENSSYQHSSKWQGFPAVLVLRAKEEGLGEAAAEYALDYLLDVPYNLAIGVLSRKHLPLGEKAWSTQCSHLVWQAYQWLGVDLDSNGWGLVTPQDLAFSEHLELVQIWGVNPQEMWN